LGTASGSKTQFIAAQKAQRWLSLLVERIEPTLSGAGVEPTMQKKMFWIIFAILGLVADFALPLMWGLLATFPIMILSWWIVYKSGWFEE
jgi:hypothetical protein